MRRRTDRQPDRRAAKREGCGRWLALPALCLLAAAGAGCENLNQQLAMSAASDAVQAATLSDDQVRALSDEATAEYDSKHPVASDDDPYQQRLTRIVAPHSTVRGIPLDYRVYLTDDVNAFAMANGTIRVYRGLMDLMTDDELLFVLGHEVGHVHHGHTKEKIQLAYSAAALRKGVAASGGTAGQLAQSQIGELAEKVANAQFSQREELQADSFGLEFMQRNGYPTDAAVSALRKLGGGPSDFLSSHPGSEQRAARLEKAISDG